MKTHHWSRRDFLTATACLPAAHLLNLPSLEPPSAKHIPVGLELYSVRESLKKDPQATVRAVGEMGYECVEFYAPYFDWSEADTKDMRKLLDQLHVRCYSTHNDSTSFTSQNLQRLLERNQILGAHYAVMASSAPIKDAAGWKEIADVLKVSEETVHRDWRFAKSWLRRELGKEFSLGA